MVKPKNLSMLLFLLFLFVILFIFVLFIVIKKEGLVEEKDQCEEMGKSDCGNSIKCVWTVDGTCVKAEYK